MSTVGPKALEVSRERPHLLIAGLGLFLLLATVLLGISVPTVFVGLLVLSAAALAIIRPEIGLHVLALNALVGLTRLVELPRVGPLSAPILIEVLLVGGVLFQIAFQRRRLHLGTPQHILLGLLALYIFFSVLMGVNVGPENFEDFRNLFLVRLIVFLLVTILITSLEGIKRLVITFMIANAGLLVLATAVRLGYFGQEKITVSQDFQRTGALLQNPNELAFNLTTMLVLTIISFLLARSYTAKTILLGLAAADLICIMSTLSRSGFISMCVVMMFLFFKLTRNLRALAVILVLALSGWVMMPEALFARFSRIDEVKDVDRLQLARVGLAMAKDHPLLGVGLGNFVSSFRDYNVSNMKAPAPAHNMYVDMTAQMGVPALLLYVGVLGVTWRGLRRLERDLKTAGETRSFPFLFGLAMQAAFVNLAVFGLSGDMEFDYGIFILLGLTLVLLRIHARRPEAA
ncbi:MAG TPA: O-antigen ligase family protein [Candidatus Polarisedimenticolia bacterium]|nr:O-antigen ligase family protein [Candidatus Polarisedimenticolia bacterium]